MGGEYSFFSKKELLYSNIEAGDTKVVARLLNDHP